MLARLCRWLRVLGCDAVVVPDHLPRSEILSAAAEAGKSGRIFLTRCQKVASSRNSAGVFWLTSDIIQEQLAHVMEHFGIRMESADVMSRCSRCGSAELAPVSHEEAAAAEEVTEHLLSKVSKFWQCGGCGKMFWIGPKSESAMQILRAVAETLPERCRGMCVDAKQQP
uniref:Mut7-C RNAse domain-containing protein n=1 Tax=Tetraselmis sp. GSL018 TaxID=582737 RepID=A0A061S9E2_9CHLO